KNAFSGGSTLHKVSPGETLFSISKKYGISVDSLKQWNKLLGNDLSVGQALIVKEATLAVGYQEPPVAPTLSGASTAASTSKGTAEVERPSTTGSKKADKKSETTSTKPEATKTQPESVRSATTPAATVSNSTPITPG